MQVGKSLLDLGPNLLHALQASEAPRSQSVGGQTARSIAHAEPDLEGAKAAGAEGRTFPRGSFVDISA